MICPECGHENEKDVTYCINCGFCFNAEKHEEFEEAIEENRVKSGIRALLSSPLFLAIAIVFGISVIVGIVYNSVGYNYLVSFLYKAARQLSMEKELYGIIYKIPTRSVFSAIFGSSLKILTLFGLFMTYISAKKASYNMNIGGLNILKISVMIYEILSIMLAVLLTFAAAYIAGVLYERNGHIINGYLATVIAVIAVCFAAAFGILAAAVIFFSKLRKMTEAAKAGLLTGKADLKSYDFTGVVCVLLAVFSLFGAVIGGIGLATAAGVLSAAAYLLFAVLFFKFSKKSKTGFAPIFNPPAQNDTEITTE